MISYILRRLLLMIPTLIGVTAVVFFIMALAPGGFGVVQMNLDEARTEGEEARRIREYFMRRYGLDQPAIVQYGRWLNQVSPIGFRTTQELKFGEAQKNEAAVVLKNASVEPTQDTLAVVTELAGYRDTEPQEAATWLIEALSDPLTGLSIVERVDGKISDRMRQRIETADSIEAQQAELIEVLKFEVGGRSRILLTRPAIKWPQLGRSQRGREVSQLLIEYVPITLLLNAITIPMIYLISIPAGMYAARHRGKFFDIASGGFMLALWSLPVIFVGVLAIGYFANAQYLQWFPTSGLHDLQADTMAFLPSWSDAGFERGWLLDTIWHLVLPVICLTYGGFAVLTKLMRGAMLESLSADYVRTARAKGVSDRDVLFRHALRNSLLPLITVAASIIPALIVGSFVVETIFSINGMGKLGIESAFQKDRELMMGITLIGGLIGLLSELVRDVCYAIADPRVAYD